MPRYVPFPFFLAIAARQLEDTGHDILLLDGVAENISRESFCRKAADFEPELIFVETSTPSLKHDLGVISELRELCPSARIAAGGTHPAALARDLFKAPGGPDFWIAGEYEFSLEALARSLASGVGDSLPPGVISAGNRGVPSADSPDVNALPLPLFDMLPMSNYSDPVCGLPSPGAQSWLSRGCPYGCTFCVWPQVVYNNRRYRARNLDLALNEVELLLDRYKCESFYFDDDTANIGEERMFKLAGAIKRRGLNAYPWAMMARADCMTPRLLEALAEAGMYSVKYGVESSSPKLLNACDKGTRWDRLEEALRRTRELGIKIHLTFTLGVPGETPETMRETIQFALETAPDTAQFSICTPFPGTAFHEQCKEQGWLVSDDWERYLGSAEAVVETPWLNAAALTEGYREAIEVWGRFTTERLELQRKRLKARLLKTVAGGARWHLRGDVSFAGFLVDQAPDLAAAQIKDDSNIDSSTVEVIVSKHDEEKIKRRLLRDKGSRPRMMCLFDA